MVILSKDCFLPCLILCKQGGRQKTKLGGSTAGTGDPNKPKGYSTPEKHHALYINWGNCLKGWLIWIWEGVSVSRSWAIASCITCWGFFLFIIIITIYHYFCILLPFQLLNWSYLNALVLPQCSSSFHWTGGERKWGSGECLCGVSSPGGFETMTDADPVTHH